MERVGSTAGPAEYDTNLFGEPTYSDESDKTWVLGSGALRARPALGSPAV